MKRRDVLNQIKAITKVLLGEGILKNYNFPFEDNNSNQVVWANFKDISFILKNREYNELFSSCLEHKAYNFMFLDGSIIQMMYKYNSRDLEEHRLLFYPNPNSPRYDDSEEFEEDHYGNKLFAEIHKQNVIIFPIRFDYSTDKEKYVEINHSYSHLTLGNYKNCRIPVSDCVEPKDFIDFILRNFYYTKYQEISGKIVGIDNISNENNILTNNEKNIMHVNIRQIRT